MAAAATTVAVPEGPWGDARDVRVSSPDRLIWPDDGITKLDLAQYAVDVRSGFMGALGHRPVTLQRFPDGITGEEFWTKNPPKGMPDFITPVMCTYPSGRKHLQVVVDEPAAVVWAMQMNTVTFHPWPVRTAERDNPDELRLDLDPQPGRGFPDAVQAAHLLRELLTELGLTGWVKTSGNRGVHVFARVRPELEFLDVRHAAIGIGRELERRAPDLVTMAWWKEERGNRVFVDFNQANRDRPMAGAYSPRPLPVASVSCPLEWDELESTDPLEHTVRTVPGRLATIGDPWAHMHEHSGRIDVLLEWWQRDLEAGLGELPFPPDFPKMPGEPMRVQPSRARNPE
jgi:bifunctional non-homologous end joining protein LigD